MAIIGMTAAIIIAPATTAIAVRLDDAGREPQQRAG
jgi:hypothetical protein